MQHPSEPHAPPPPAPPAPPAPPVPGAVIALPDGVIPLAGLPRTAAEIEGLQARREILRDQLSRATNRRDQLARQLDRGVADGASAGIQQRLALLDERILQLEREQALTERQLSNAPPEVLARSTEAPREGPVVSEDEAFGVAFGTFGLGVVLTVLVGRLRRRRARSLAGTAPAANDALNDPRFERLTLAVDAMAEEVERIGEGQRFVTQLLAARRDMVPALGEEGARR
ncbi:MAG: hypothetical protein AVDCRST_MAG11-2794 [uncultured Gemmatimonadaceae bacterium]|uniref:Uncharacterized protein n=1 Tax=uncultured Gemmatimonadaceae bacterium TaxID=246130 RepID=A0A6J4LND0_9BACT|nr:MAG: hypothetical protein AVDCRST_MAG11-2794 [uncultured Gemmatimonadaceae bacterium]